MYPIEKLTSEQKGIYESLRSRIDSRYSVEEILKRFRKTELREFLEQSEELPSELVNNDKGLSRRLYRINMALARRGGSREED